MMTFDVECVEDSDGMHSVRLISGENSMVLSRGEDMGTAYGRALSVLSIAEDDVLDRMHEFVRSAS